MDTIQCHAAEICKHPHYKFLQQRETQMFTKFDVSTHLFNVFANVIDLQNESASKKLKDAIMNNH